jgi:hypothetical protein
MKKDTKFLILLDKFFRETPRKEIKEIISKYDRMKFNGPTLKEYLNEN